MRSCMALKRRTSSATQSLAALTGTRIRRFRVAAMSCITAVKLANRFQGAEGKEEPTARAIMIEGRKTRKNATKLQKQFITMRNILAALQHIAVITGVCADFIDRSILGGTDSDTMVPFARWDRCHHAKIIRTAPLVRKTQKQRHILNIHHPDKIRNRFAEIPFAIDHILQS